MKNKGFTLIELSIVMIIIALIIGGVLVGQNLIRSAELNSFIKDIQKFDSAVKGFQAQYNQLPGDMDRAYDYWDSECATEAGFCNGDGNGYIVLLESPRAWKHLSLAKYINDAIAVRNDEILCVTEDLPQTAISNTASLFTVDNRYGPNPSLYNYGETPDAASSTVTPGQMMLFEKQRGECSIQEGFLTSEQLYLIDSKIDDGLAYSGKVLNSQNVEGCSTSASDGEDNGEYDLANSGNNLCVLYWRLKVD